MDVYWGYYQFPLAEVDQDKVNFIKVEGTFCYTILSFRLKNTIATYQKLMDKLFTKQLVVYNVEVYIDDILVKTK